MPNPKRFWKRSAVQGRSLVSAIILAAFFLAGASGQAQVSISDYMSTPVFVSKAYAPNVLLLVSNDHTNFFAGYPRLDYYDNSLTYYGYFDPNQGYKYDDRKGFFYTQDNWRAANHYVVDPATGREPDGSNGLIAGPDKDMWSGNFLNWVTMCQADFIRKTLTGGRVVDTDNTTYWILERGNVVDYSGDAQKHAWTKTWAPPGAANPDIGLLTPLTVYVPADYTPQYPNPANRILSYDFEPATWPPGPVIHDTAGADNAGAAMNAPIRDTSSKIGGVSSLNLNGSNQYVEIPHADEITNLGGRFSIDFWMRRDTSTNDEAIIIGNVDPTLGQSQKDGYEIRSAKGYIRFRLWRSGSTGIYAQLDSATKPDSAWHHIVCVYDRDVDVDGDPTTPGEGVMQIYVDGCLDAELTKGFFGDVGDSGSKTYIGWDTKSSAGIKRFAGNLDEVSIWKEALSATMVRSRYEHTWTSRTVNCLVTAGAGTYLFENSGTTMAVKIPGSPPTPLGTYTVRVKLNEEPRGLIQEFAGSIRFGLMSYSYDAEDKGGVLRSNISGPGITADTRQLISFINNFTRKGWDPAGELFWEATRYFRGYSANTEYRQSDNDGFPIPAWVDPVTDKCQRNFIILVNDEYPSHDMEMPGGYVPGWYATAAVPPVTAVPAENAIALAPATVKGVTAPRGGLDAQWWTDLVGDLEGITDSGAGSGTPRRVGTYDTNNDEQCDPAKTVYRLSRAFNTCPNEPKNAQQASFNLAGAAYWAHMTHLRPDVVSNAELVAHPEKRISVETFSIAQRATPYGYQQPYIPMSQLWLAAKYGGFQDKNGNGYPDLQEEWDGDGDGVPDNFSYAEQGGQFADALRRTLITILYRAVSGTAASILSSSRSGQGALYQAMFYPGRVDELGNAVEWTGQLEVFWMDQYGEMREDTVAYDSSTLPATIRQPFTGTSVSTSGLQQLKGLDRKLDKVIKLNFDTTMNRTRAKTYEVSQFGRVLSGKATKADTTGVLWDDGASFPQLGVKPGYVVENVTKGTQATIDSPTTGQETVKATSIKASGIPQWDPGDEYIISQQGPDSPKELDELKPVWDGSLWLAEHGAKDRRNFTWVDLDSDGQVDGSRGLFDMRVSGDELMELAGSGTTSVTIGTGSRATSVSESSYVLETDSIASTLRPYLRATSSAQAAQIINWIRGVDQPDSGLRQRAFLTPNNRFSGSLRTLKLGDIVHSTPTVVGTPAENFDLIYKDSSYTEFYRQYGDRRNVVYVGANDGMLHAFNGGFYDRDLGIFYDNTGHLLGEELWAFIPYQLLPHLEFLTEAQYVHVYYVDLKPKVFDARVFTPDSVHVNGWGTLLLVGMGMGGKGMTVDVNANGSYEPAETFRSAYILFDVTDPLQPRFLGSYTDSNLGQTTSYPAVFRIKDKWFMVVGSGPNGADAYAGVSAQRAYIYVVEVGPSGFGPKVVKHAVPDAEATAFMGDPSVVDLDLRTAPSGKYLDGVNWSAEVIYIGSVYDADGIVGTPYQWRGRMYHIRLTSDASLTTPDDTGLNWAYEKLAESSPSLRMGPITAAANVARDDNGRRWVYFGTGRLFSSDDLINTDRQAFFGLKEPVYTSGPDLGKPTLGTVTIEPSTDPKSTASLFDATSAKVYEGGAVDVDGNGSIDYAAAVAGGWNGFVQTLDSSKNGWVIQTSPGERILGTAAVFGGVVAFSSWQPPGAAASGNCLPDGTSTLFSPFYKTGTAFTGSIIGLGNDTYSGHPEVLRQRSLGTGISSTPTVHVGEAAKAFIQSSTGAIADTEIKTVYPVKSGVRSWRLH